MTLPRSDSRWIWLLAAVGVAVLAGLWWNGNRTLVCGSDFASFYAGGRLVGPGLYDTGALLRLQQELVGCTNEATWFIRLPYFALLMRPFALLPYGAALSVWLLLGLGAAAAFVALWPRRAWAAAACAWSFALLVSFSYGQDVPFLLLAVGTAMWCLRRGREELAGLAVSVLAAKVHLMMLVPALILGGRRWRFGLGWMAGGAVWFVLSMVAMGVDWPWVFYEVVRHGVTAPRPQNMTNLHGLVLSYPEVFGGWGQGLELAAMVVGFAGVARLAARRPAEEALAAAIAVGVFVAGHSNAYDLALCLPAALLYWEPGQPKVLRWAALAMLLPVSLLTPAPPPVPLLVLSAAIVFQSFRGDKPKDGQAAAEFGLTPGGLDQTPA